MVPVNLDPLLLAHNRFECKRLLSAQVGMQKHVDLIERREESMPIKETIAMPLCKKKYYAIIRNTPIDHFHMPC